ncbi:MAG: hypothetical protein ABL958_11110 [Bdellovibrionia bacterium]
MKLFVYAVTLIAMSLFAANSFAKPKASANKQAKTDTCHFSNMKQLEDHLANHITFPATGKDIKAACKKEWPDEFTAEESACVDSKLQDGVTYTKAEEVKKALGI